MQGHGEGGGWAPRLGGSRKPVQMFLLRSQRERTLLGHDPVLFHIIVEFPIRL